MDAPTKITPTKITPTKIRVGLLLFVLVTAVAVPIGADRLAPESIGDLRAERRRLDAEMVTASRRVVIGDNLAIAFIEGRIGLAEATRDFLALHEDNPPFHEQHQRVFPGLAPFEYAARSMANRILGRLDNLGPIDDPRLKQRVVDRLTGEFGALFPSAAPLPHRSAALSGHALGPGPPRAPALARTSHRTE